MNWLGLLGAWLTFACAGVGTALLISRGRTQINGWEVGAVGWLFGLGIVSLCLWLGGFFSSGGILFWLVTAVALALGAGGYRVIFRERARLIFPLPRNLMEWLLTGILAVQCGLMGALSFRRGLGWDGLLNWEIKARYAFLNHGVLPGAYLADGGREFTHPGYPLLVPFSELWVYLWLGQPHQFWLKSLPPFLVLAGVVLLVFFGTRLTGRRWIGLGVAVLFFCIPALSSMEGGAYSGYADVPVGFLYLGAMGFLLLQRDGDDRAGWRMFAIFLALLPWAKREGVILCAVGAMCGLLVFMRSTHPRRELLWLLLGPALAIGWGLYGAAMGKGVDHEFLPVSRAVLQENLPRLVPIAGAVLAEMMDRSHWSFFWPMALLAFLSLLWRAPDFRLFILAFALAAPLVVYPVAYVFSGWADWLGHAHVSLPRLLLHLLPVAWLVVALALRSPAPAQRASAG